MRGGKGDNLNSSFNLNLKEVNLKQNTFSKKQMKSHTMNFKDKEKKFTTHTLQANNNIPSQIDPQGKIFTEIKSFLNRRRKQTQKELLEQNERIRLKEMELKNITVNFRHKWRKLQSKTLFLSLLRRSLKNNRNFGMKPKKRRGKKEVNQTLDEFEVHESPKKWFIIYPEDRVHRIHVFLMVIMMIFLIIYTPLDIAFGYEDKNKALIAANWVVSAYFMLDVLLGFVMPFKQEGKLIDNLKLIAVNYAKGWLLFDLLAVFPFDIFFDFNRARLKGLLKLPRILRIINSIMQNNDTNKRSSIAVNTKLKSIFSSSKTLFIMKSLGITAIFVHVTSCIWITISKINPDNWFDQ